MSSKWRNEPALSDRAGKMMTFFPVLPFCHFYDIGR